MNIKKILNLLNVEKNHSCDDQQLEVTGYCFDTRALKPGEIFCALKGDNDGHAFISQAIEAGAAACLIDDKTFMQNKCIFVPNVLKALEHIALHYRTSSNAKVVAITGSSGKTTTKEMLRHALQAQGKTVFSKKSFNNHIGVPFSLTEMRPSVKYGVFEVGMNNPGEIFPLAKLIDPDIAIITTINESHIGHMGSLEAICDEKSEIFSHLSSDGHVILNRDNEFFNSLKDKALSKGIKNIVTVGQNSKADIQLIDYQAKENSSLITVNVFGKIHAYPMLCIGEHIAFNSLFVIAACHILGCDMGKVYTSISKIAPVDGRCSIKEVTLSNTKTFTLLDDAYNANPSSMMAGLKLLSQLPTKPGAKRYAILGAMKELGSFSVDLHKKVGAFINTLEIDGIICIGSETEPLFTALDKHKQIKFSSDPAIDSVMGDLLDLINNGDIVLIKGSKSTNLWKITQELHAA